MISFFQYVIFYPLPGSKIIVKMPILYIHGNVTQNYFAGKVLVFLVFFLIAC